MTAPKSKPDPGHIYMAAGHENASRIAMIGDSFPDMEAARRANVFAVLMTYGYSFEPHTELRADARLREFRNLVPTLVEHFGQRGCGGLNVLFSLAEILRQTCRHAVHEIGADIGAGRPHGGQKATLDEVHFNVVTTLGPIGLDLLF